MSLRLSKATYKSGHYRSNQNQQKSNNMQVLLQILVSLMQYTLEGFLFLFLRTQVYRI